VSFAVGGFDTHGANHRGHALLLQDLFDMIATLIKTLDRTPHPVRAGTMLSESTHVVVLSEFCRTPQINPAGGRDHYPNNSALVISPKFRGGTSVGSTDPEQLLPRDAGRFASGSRPLAPPDFAGHAARCVLDRSPAVSARR